MALRSFIMVKCIYVTCVFIELEKGDEKEGKLPAKRLVRPEQYTWAQLMKSLLLSGRKRLKEPAKRNRKEKVL